MEEQEKQKVLYDEMAKFAEKFISRVSVGLVDFPKDDYGSGTLLEYGGRFFVLTAEHVCQNSKFEDITFIYGLDAGSNDSSIHPISRGSFNERELGIDVAYFEIDNGDIEKLLKAGKDFISPDKIQISAQLRLDDGFLAVHGLPRQFVKEAQTDIYAFGPLFFFTDTVESENWGNRKPCAEQFFVEFPKEVTDLRSSWKIKLPTNICGISGGGVWKLLANEEGLWSGKIELVGLITHWRPKEHYIIATKASALTKIFPDL